MIRSKCVCHFVQRRRAINYVHYETDGVHGGGPVIRRATVGNEASSGNREEPSRLINREITRYARLRCFFVSSLIGAVGRANVDASAPPAVIRNVHAIRNSMHLDDIARCLGDDFFRTRVINKAISSRILSVKWRTMNREEGCRITIGLYHVCDI